MGYFYDLNLQREPFAAGQDPDLFYQAPGHIECLHRLEIAIRLKRGLNIVTGDAGTGKTALCRQLAGRFARDGGTDVFFIPNPGFKSGTAFLQHLDDRFNRSGESGDAPDIFRLKERIRQFLFLNGVDKKRITAVLIDNGQDLPSFCVELLRELLNYETNEFKLLQIILFGRKKMEKKLAYLDNFTDRINLHLRLKPFKLRDTKCMIQTRLARSVWFGKPAPCFSTAAVLYIQWVTRGYPGKIVPLCRLILMAMGTRNSPRANLGLVRFCAANNPSAK